MKVKNSFIFILSFLLALTATPLLAVSGSRRTGLRRRPSFFDFSEEGEENSYTTREQELRNQEAEEIQSASINETRGYQLSNEKPINSFNMSSIKQDGSLYSSIPSYPPNAEVKGAADLSPRIIQSHPSEGNSWRRGIEDGGDSFDGFTKTTTQLTDHDIQIVTGQRLDSQSLHSIIGKNKKIADLNQQISLLKQEYTTQKKLIINEAKQKIANVESRAQLTPEQVIAQGLPSGLMMPSYQQKSILQKINADKETALNVLSFKYMKESSRLQEFRCARLLEKRFIRNEASIEDQMSRLDPSSSEARIFKALELKQRAFDFLGDNPELASTEDLTFVADMISYANNIATVVFSEGAEKKIEEATLQLGKVPDSLNAIANDDLPQKNKFSSHQLIQELQEFCQQNYAELQFAQIISDQEAEAVAAKSAAKLFEKAQKLRVDAENGRKQIPFATVENQKNLNKQADKFSELASVLEQTAFAYDKIADACTVELRTVPLIKANLLNSKKDLSISSMMGASQSSELDSTLEQRKTSKAQMLADLSFLLDVTDLQPSDTREAFGLDFLSQLETIKGHDEEAITALHSKIVLTQIPSPFPVDANRQFYINGIHLIRLDLFRDFGSHGLQRFDNQFAPNIEAETPIRLQEIREFIAQEKTTYNNPSSYFIAEHHSIEELLKIPLDSLEAQKVIKADSSSIISFNPYLITSTIRNPLADEAGSIQRGIATAKITLKNFLEKESVLDPVQIVTILKNFDAAFNDTDPAKQLTVGKLKAFTENELKRALAGMSLVEWLSASPRNSGVNSLIWRVVTAGTSSILMSSPHLSALSKFIIIVSEQAISDQTILWRARPGGSANGGGH